MRVVMGKNWLQVVETGVTKVYGKFCVHTRHNWSDTVVIYCDTQRTPDS